MQDISEDTVARLVSHISLMTTTMLVAQTESMKARGISPCLAAKIMLDVALISAVSYIETGLSGGTIGSKLPVPQLLHQRLDELLAMPRRVHDLRPDGSFDPTGQTVQ